MRHEIGTWVPFEMQDNYLWAEAQQYGVIVENPANIVKNMASFRYIDKGAFDYAMPAVIAKDEEAKKMYDGAMQFLSGIRSDLKATLMRNGCDVKGAIEAVNMLMPRATTTDLIIGFTPEALIHFCHKRLCTRAQEFINELARKMKEAVAFQNKEFAARLVPQCEYLLYCPEGNMCCGKTLTRNETAELLRAVLNASRKEMQKP